MLILGLTGSIGMGKTAAAAAFRRLGVPVYEADEIVHRLMQPGGKAYTAIAADFPQAVIDGIIDRHKLGGLVFGDQDKLGRLEAILHPLVRREARRFKDRYRRRGAKLIVLDIPLLFETNQENTVDLVATVSAPLEIQKARVLARPGMDEKKLAAILAKQMPDDKKRQLSDIVIDTSGSTLFMQQQLRRLLKRLDLAHARNRSRHRNHRAGSRRRPPHH